MSRRGAPAGSLSGVGGPELGGEGPPAARQDVEHHAAALALDPPQPVHGRQAAAWLGDLEEVAHQAGHLHAHEHRLAVADVAGHQGQVLGVVDLAAEEAGAVASRRARAVRPDLGLAQAAHQDCSWVRR